jgi:hypothetical protein
LDEQGTDVGPIVQVVGDDVGLGLAISGRRLFADGLTRPVYEDERGQFIVENLVRIPQSGPRARGHNRGTGAGSGWCRFAGVDSSQLKPWQAKVLCAALGPTVGYLCRLRDRMDKRGFPPKDELFRLTVAAYEALHAWSRPAQHVQGQRVEVARRP